jgi:hypothetical protein
MDIQLKVTILACRMVAFLFIFIFSFGFFSSITHAQSQIPTTISDDFGVDVVGEEISIPASPDTDLRVLVVRVINVLLGFLGLVAFLVVLYAGYLWMTSGGNEEQVGTAKKMLINGVIGLAIILSAFTITSFILRALRGLGEGGPSGTAGAPPQVQTYAFSGALGRIIKDHYPRRGQDGVPRNTSIIVTFGVPVNPASIIRNANRNCWNADFTSSTTACVDLGGTPVTASTPIDQIARPYFGDCVDLNFDGVLDTSGDECDQLNTGVVTIGPTSEFTSGDGVNGILAAALSNYDSDRNVFTFVFRPHTYLGSASEQVPYRVRLGTDITRSDRSESVFTGGTSYLWDFTVSNLIDVDPPTVVDMYPAPNTTIPRNSIIQITFSEPIDPTTVESLLEASTQSTFTPVNRVLGDTRNVVPGSWRLSNGYQTLEFISSEACGTNSCGEQMFCLPVTCDGPNCLNPYETLLRTAVSTNNAESPFEAAPFSGIYDLALNGLDNPINNATVPRLTRPSLQNFPVIVNGDRAPDNVWWSFVVENTIDRSAPYIREILPAPGAENVSGDSPLYIQFSKRMMSNSIAGVGVNRGITLEEYPANVCADAAIDTESPNVCSDDLRLPPIDFWLNSDFTDDVSVTVVGHREFGPNNLDLYYFPSVPSTVKSVNQNCLYPGRGPAPSALPASEVPAVCVVTVDGEGNFVAGEGCATVSHDSTSDTACVYDPASPQSLADISECLNMLYSESTSSY